MTDFDPDLAHGYHDIWGHWHQVPENRLHQLSQALATPTDSGPLPPYWVGYAQRPLTLKANDSLPAGQWQIQDTELTGDWPAGCQCELPRLAMGRYQLQVQWGTQQAETTVLIRPNRAFQPKSWQQGQRQGGWAVQLYSLRSYGNWGVGDFTDLMAAIDQIASQSGQWLGLSPLHALSWWRPEDASPYSANSRYFINSVYLDITAIDEFDQCHAAQQLWQQSAIQQQLHQLRNSRLVDYPQVIALKQRFLRLLFADFSQASLQRQQRFAAYRQRMGQRLQHYCIFEALRGHHPQCQNQPWWQWPKDYRHPDQPAVRAFAQHQQIECDFIAYVQWLADEQMARVYAHAQQKGVGLYQDLAVGPSRDSADVWSEADLYASELSVGAPPDDFSLQGQNWGLPPMRPNYLRQTAMADFRDLLTENMRYADALRIDHIMALARLFIIPPEQDPSAGSYLHYPAEGLFATLAMVSQQQQCAVIGEDLGTVPNNVREQMQQDGLLSYRLLYFENNHEGYPHPAQHYPKNALCAVGTHDLPPFRGYWQGFDIHSRWRLGFIQQHTIYQQQLAHRRQHRQRLLRAFGLAGEDDRYCGDYLLAAYHYLFNTPCLLTMMQIEDAFEQVQAMNLPGSHREYPNWQQRLAVPIEQWHHQPLWQQLNQLARQHLSA